MSDKKKSPGSELFEQAMTNYEGALRAGLKLQEESAKWWTDVMGQGFGPADWQKQWQKSAIETIPIVQKRMEESLRLLEQSSRSSLELLKQAMKLTASDSTAEAQKKLQELGEASLEVMRDSGQALAQANTKVVESCVRLFTMGAEAATPKSPAT